MFGSISPLTLIGAILIGAVAAYLAHRRERNIYVWFFVGFFFGILGVIALFFAPLIKRKKRESKVRTTAEQAVVEPIRTILGPKDKFWYYLDPSNQQLGPVSHDALTSAWKEGKVSLKTFVWHEELSEWKPLQELLK